MTLIRFVLLILLSALAGLALAFWLASWWAGLWWMLLMTVLIGLVDAALDDGHV